MHCRERLCSVTISDMDPSLTNDGVFTRAESRRALRNDIESILPDDAEFEAFCAALFPDTKQYFTDSMDRKQKINLLLSIAPHEVLATQLSRYFQSDPELPVFSILGNYLR